jgi:hypothetical protein
MDKNTEYEHANILDAVRSLRTYLNSLDNIRTQLFKVRPIVQTAHSAKIDKMETKMAGMSLELMDILSGIEACDEYRNVLKYLKVRPADD